MSPTARRAAITTLVAGGIVVLALALWKLRLVLGLAGLEELPVRGSYFVFLPLKIAESSGGNGRAFAYVPKE